MYARGKTGDISIWKGKWPSGGKKIAVIDCALLAASENKLDFILNSIKDELQNKY